jgi:hypothetical protein
MGLKDVFSRKKDDPDAYDGSAAGDGDVSSQVDTRGEGPVTLEDRTAPGGQGSPDTNQGKTEPGIPASGEAGGEAAAHVPDLQSMNVGSADPQSPEHPAARGTASSAVAGPGDSPLHAPRDMGGPGGDADSQRPSIDSETSTGRAPGPETPHQVTTGTAHRAPGSQGSTPDGERIETDVEASAAAMVRDTGRPSGSGDPQSVAVPSETPTMGTSEEHGVVQGARIPDPDGPE